MGKPRSYLSKLTHTQRSNCFRKDPVLRDPSPEERLKNIHRSELYHLADQLVSCSGDIKGKLRKHSVHKVKHILVTDLVINKSIYIEYAWISISAREIKKLLLVKDLTRIYFTAKVLKYAGMSLHKTKIGLRDLKLVSV